MIPNRQPAFQRTPDQLAKLLASYVTYQARKHFDCVPRELRDALFDFAGHEHPQTTEAVAMAAYAFTAVSLDGGTWRWHLTLLPSCIAFLVALGYTQPSARQLEALRPVLAASPPDLDGAQAWFRSTFQQRGR